MLWTKHSLASLIIFFSQILIVFLKFWKSGANFTEC